MAQKAKIETPEQLAAELRAHLRALLAEGRLAAVTDGSTNPINGNINTSVSCWGLTVICNVGVGLQ